jgi:hypothetical protein
LRWSTPSVSEGVGDEALGKVLAPTEEEGVAAAVAPLPEPASVPVGAPVPAGLALRLQLKGAGPLLEACSRLERGRAWARRTAGGVGAGVKEPLEVSRADAPHSARAPWARTGGGR